ncbi:MAG: carboxymuconolactone decarboxylase family protein [Halioglobus sp.]
MTNDSGPRIPPLRLEDCDDQQKEVLRPWTLPDGRIYNLFLTTARHPDLLRRWYPYGMHVMVKSTLPKRDRELVIMRVSVHNQSDYEWAHHAKISHQVGISDEELLRIIEGPSAENWTDFERLLLQAVDEMKTQSTITDATYNGLAAEYDVKQIMDLVHTFGAYNLVSMSLNIFGVELEDEVEGLTAFKERLGS